jgi:hypothetical protein
VQKRLGKGLSSQVNQPFLPALQTDRTKSHGVRPGLPRFGMLPFFVSKLPEFGKRNGARNMAQGWVAAGELRRPTLQHIERPNV